MEIERFDALSPRHRDCLRLSFERLRTKEIAQTLGISPGTVNKYCTEAIAILGARDRRHAADMLAAHEGSAPLKFYPPSNGVVQPPAEAPAIPADSVPPSPGRWMPLRRKGGKINELSFIARILWVPALAIILAASFGLLALGVRTISQLVFGGE